MKTVGNLFCELGLVCHADHYAWWSGTLDESFLGFGASMPVLRIALVASKEKSSHYSGFVFPYNSQSVIAVE